MKKVIWISIFGKPYLSPATHSPEVVELVDVVEVTGCEETETITDGNRC